MERLESYDALAPLLTAQLRRGILTNGVASRGDCQRELAAGSLWAHAFPGGLLLLRRREDHWRISFSMRDGARPALPPLDLPAVVELPGRLGDQSTVRAGELWEEAGFRVLLRRERLALPPDAHTQPGPFAVSPAAPGDGPQADALLRACFSPLTGCLPTREELDAGLAAGQLLLARAADGKLAGLLHFLPQRGSSQLRHLAVLPPFRRLGAGQSLLHAYLEAAGRRRSVVWTAQDNAAAQRLYRKNGYAPDGWAAAVMAWFPPEHPRPAPGGDHLDP